MSDVLRALTEPIVQAPMAGGPARPELAAAVGRAGGLGFLAAGMKTPDLVRTQIEQIRAIADVPFGVNLFCPPLPFTDHDTVAVAAYLHSMSAEVDTYGVMAGEPHHSDDYWAAKLAIVRELAVPVVSFIFGCPPADVVEDLHEAGCEVWVTATTPYEAARAVMVGADAVVAQGVEAGGHRGTFTNDLTGDFGLLTLLQLVTDTHPDLDVVGAGGVMTGRGVAAVVVAGARAAALGTAFLRTPEAGTHPTHRAGIEGDARTTLTRAFTGRPARAVMNRFIRDHSEEAPAAYPDVLAITTPFRQAAAALGDTEGFASWAGQGYRLAGTEPAEDLVRRLGRDFRAALGRTL